MTLYQQLSDSQLLKLASHTSFLKTTLSWWIFNWTLALVWMNYCRLSGLLADLKKGGRSMFGLGLYSVVRKIPFHRWQQQEALCARLYIYAILQKRESWQRKKRWNNTEYQNSSKTSTSLKYWRDDLFGMGTPLRCTPLFGGRLSLDAQLNERFGIVLRTENFA